MRPLRLTMEAFGSYAKPQTVDFTELGDHRLFLIHGPTGSGKTTVLDAICFALYGDATGEERDGKGMRSDFASPESTTRVTLDFAVGDRQFRVERQPEQWRPKVRGDGFTKTPPAATLWERTGIKGDKAEGPVLASKWTEVSNVAIELLGFRSEQFRQVIVLPQGRFRDLLLAKSADREQILQQLFDTSFYRRVQDRLKERTATLRKESEHLQTGRTTLLDQADCDSDSDLAELIETLKAEQLQLDKQMKDLAKRTAAATKALERAATVEKLFAKAEAAETALKSLESLQKQIRETKQRADLAEKAAGLADFVATIEERRNAFQEAVEELEACTEAEKAAAKAFAEATHRLQKEKGRDAERKSLEKQIADIERVRPLVDQLVKAAAQVEKLEDDYGEATVSLQAAEENLETITRDLNLARKQIEQTQESKIDRRVLQRAVKDADQALVDWNELTDLKKALKEAQVATKKTSSAEATAEAQLASAKNELEAVRAAREQGSAALLAHELKTGEPCPVCGSTEHPAPAKGKAEIPDAEAVESARKALHAAERQFREASAAAKNTDKIFQSARARTEAAESRLGEGAAPVSELRTNLQKAQKALDAHDKEAGALQKLISLRKQLEKDEASARTELKAAKTVSEAISKRLAAAEATCSEKRKQVPARWRDAEKLAASLESALEKSANLQQALADAEAAEKKTSGDHREDRTALKEAEKRQKKAHSALEKTEGQWQERLKAAGFKGEKEYATAVLEPDELQSMKEEIKSYDENLISARTLAKDAAAAIKGKKRPDVAQLSEAADAAEAAQQETADASGANRQKVRSLTETQAGLAKLTKKIKKIEKEYGTVGALSAAANGQNSLRVSLQRFVLATRLDDVLIAATRRLESMSRGRYRLQRNMTADDKRAAGGLELEVEDAYTGKSRPVATLSGGESFQAALALALGLSETVQAYSGGIRLDTIFVDEGFGSLDPEALDLAVNTLIDLQQTGRMVGVISHVPELKERIDVRLEISATKSGSRAQFRLP